MLLQGNGWSSGEVSIHQYASSSAADIYVGPGGSDEYSVSLTPPVRGQGSSKTCPTLASPPPPPPGSKGDPHFTGADNSHYDFTGQWAPPTAATAAMAATAAGVLNPFLFLCCLQASLATITASSPTATCTSTRSTAGDSTNGETAHARR